MSMPAVTPPPTINNATINPNALSLFFPNDQSMTTPTTFTHLLNLPPLLQPISPALAALHLARIRLVLSIPPGVIDQTAWCPTCGGLREARVTPPVSPNSAGKGSKKKSSPKRKSAKSGGGVNKIKWQKQCGRCGSDYKKPKPDIETRAFPSARAVRAVRMKRNSETDPDPEIEAGHLKTELMDLDPAAEGTSSSSPFSNSNLSTPFEIHAPMELPSEPLIHPIQSSIMPLPSPTPAYQIPPPPKYVHNHSLIHVHTSSPHPPTYPQPPPAKNVSPPPKEKSKKRKKSGLARLLAENKEREAGNGHGNGAGGSWGLD